MTHQTHDLSSKTTGHMADADRLRDCLGSAKERAKMYASAALEATNNGVREFFLAMHGEETHNAEILWSFLHTRGFYPVEMATEERIQKARQHFQKEHDALGMTDEPAARRYQTADPKLPPAEMQNPGNFQYK